MYALTKKPALIDIRNATIWRGSTRVFEGLDLEMAQHERVAILGPNGSGKTTLLNMIGCLDRPSAGRLSVLDTQVGQLDRRGAAAFRGEHIGFVFQDFNLIPVLTAYENVEYPLIMVQKWSASARRERVRSLLAAAGIDLGDVYPEPIVDLKASRQQALAIWDELAEKLGEKTVLVLAGSGFLGWWLLGGRA